ncbi:hypothetical protein SAMN05660642_03051 [Geodermatophilus siccatus]|uniref:Uncharacterized protein n=2 Tax=Geodermatophilus siccatus TaxID=1137991 RepID=A0A1G9V1K5_9ACTN|nr:hypothetical protein SAMN05660642_03051 [Geodermatophilus siccatus]
MKEHAGIRLLEGHQYDLPDAILVEHDGQWWPGFLCRRLLCNDGRGSMAKVESSVQHKWGGGKRLQTVPPERICLAH